jgi:prepilin-type N-terminal cleavage/methylation domain-containing protein
VRTRVSKERGFTLIELMIVVGIVGMLATMGLPNFLKTRTTAQARACVSNLRVLEDAKQTWGLEHGKRDGDEPTEAELIGPGLYIKKMPECPAGGTYEINPIGVNATCSIGGEHSL